MRSSGRSLSHLVCLLCPCSGAAVALSQDAGSPALTTAQTEPSSPTRRFQNFALPQDGVSGPFSLRAGRVWRWTDAGGADGAPLCRRFFLRGDVQGTIGPYSFTAGRAVLWCVPRKDAKTGVPTLHVFGYLADLREVRGASGEVRFEGKTLPVRAVLLDVDTPALTADLVTDGAPGFADASRDAEASREADAALARMLDRLASGADAPVIPTSPPLSRDGFVFTPTGQDGPDEPGTQASRTPTPEANAIAPPPLLSSAANRPPPSEHNGDTKQPEKTMEREAVVLPSRMQGLRLARLKPPPAAVPPPPTQPPISDNPGATPPEVFARPIAKEPEPRNVLTTPSEPAGAPDASPTKTRTEAPAQATGPPPVSPTARTTDTAVPGTIFAKTGVFTLAGGNAELVPSERESSLLVTGGVTLLYEDKTTGRTLQVAARRAVFFLSQRTGEAHRTDASRFDASELRGFYAEGEVTVTDGQYTVRSPRVYYDVDRDSAVMLDAVFWTYDQQRDLPLYVRAKEIRQESSRQFVAKQATFTNSGFLEPELAIGTSSVTITKRQRDASASPSLLGGLWGGMWGDGLASVHTDDSDDPNSVPSARPAKAEQYTWLQAKNITLSAAGVPIFWWPSYGGDPNQPLLHDFRFENRSGSGAAIKARWNAYSLLGLTKPHSITTELLTDLYLERGIGLGAKVGWNTERHVGGVFGYMVPFDSGNDILKPGSKIDADGKFRGLLTLENRTRLTDRWTVLAEAVSISDPRMIDAFFELDGEARREFTTRVVGTRVTGNSWLQLTAQGKLEDFIANEWLLQSRGYSVSTFPEVVYARQADDLLPEDAPGAFTHYAEYRAGRYALAFDEALARDRGFDFLPTAQRAFGVDPNQSIAQRLRASGLNEDWVTRADTRQEVVATLRAGPVRVTPFVVGRATFYDNDFAGFSSRVDGNDSVRLWTAAGVKFSTTLTRVWDNIDSRVLDLHRLRHIVEPSATLWASGTNVEARDIPAYDGVVDSLADGAAVRVGVTQTLQTQRGGVGRYIDVDLLKVTTDFVFASDDTTRRSPLGRFFDARPEYSAFGNFFVGEAVYRMTDAVSIAGSTVFDFDTNQQDLSAVGIIIDHAPGFSTAMDLRFVNPQDSTIFGVYGSYELTSKYSIAFSPAYDISAGEFQALNLGIRRKFSALELGVGVQYNNITNETGFSFIVQPYGGGRGVGIEGLGSDTIGAFGN